MKKLETVLRIGYADFSIFTTDEDRKEIDNAMGICYPNLHEIFISTKYNEIETVNTLIHEILHAVYHQANLECGDTEERLVCTLTNGLVAVFRNNPQLVKYIKRLNK